MSNRKPVLVPPPFVPPAGHRGEDILIVWDLQNVRMPDELDPEDILRWVLVIHDNTPPQLNVSLNYCSYDTAKLAVT